MPSEVYTAACKRWQNCGGSVPREDDFLTERPPRSVDVKSNRKGQTITYVYDDLNRLTSKTYPDTTSVEYTYDLVGKVLQVNDPTGTYAFAYDNMGRLVGTTSSYSFLTSRNFTTSYSYDAGSNRTGFTDPEGGSTGYTYDTLNRLTALAPPSAFGSGSFGFGYDSLSRRTQMTRPNNVTTNYTYNSLSRLLSVLHQAGSSTIDGASYGLDNAGNRTAKTDWLANATSNYTYDQIYELTQVAHGTNTTESYTYDPVGNRQSSLGVGSYSVNNSNELTSTPSASYTYDSNGNTLTKTVGSNTTTYAWDYENRLTSVTLPGTGGTVTFKYDPLGRRIEKVSPTFTSIFAYDGNSLTETVNSSGGVVARYTQTGNVDEPLAELRSSTTSYFEADGLGSITSLTSAAGAVASTYTYDSYGNVTASSGSISNPFQYTGREFDSETGLYYYRARYYDPSSGRLLTEDPLAFASGVNFYEYALNNPLLYGDPTGLTIHLNGSPQDSGNYQTAITYLQQDPGMAKIIHDLSTSSTDYLIDFNHNDDDSFNPSTNTINWDPASALSVPGGSQTPALGLGHEMAHADENSWLNWILRKIPWPDYDNLEERRVITGAECKAAQTLGETPRQTHQSPPLSVFPVPTPTSR